MAITGTRAMRDSSSSGSAGRPTKPKMKAATTITASRNPVPQRGCRVLWVRTFGTSSGSPASKALIVLCSAPW